MTLNCSDENIVPSSMALMLQITSQTSCYLAIAKYEIPSLLFVAPYRSRGSSKVLKGQLSKSLEKSKILSHQLRAISMVVISSLNM